MRVPHPLRFSKGGLLDSLQPFGAAEAVRFPAHTVSLSTDSQLAET